MSTIDRPISPKRKLQPDDLFFINTDYLRKLLSLQSKLVDTAEAVSVNSIQKYMCQHKRLNPLAVNKFKLRCKERIKSDSKILKNLIKSESFENASEFDAIIEIEVWVILKYEEFCI